MKKAMELSILCGCEVAVTVFGLEKQLYDYASSDVAGTLKKVLKHTGERETLTDKNVRPFPRAPHSQPADGASISQLGEFIDENGNQIPDTKKRRMAEAAEEEEEEEVPEVPVKKFKKGDVVQCPDCDGWMQAPEEAAGLNCANPECRHRIWPAGQTPPEEEVEEAAETAAETTAVA
jgi:hypothetical protein